MKIAVINLDHADQRWAFQSAQAARLGLNITRVKAMRGAEIDETRYRAHATKGLRLMTRNEVACFLSHQQCWEQAIEWGEPVIILEDDVVLSAHFPAALKALEAFVPNGPMLINLEMYSPDKRLHKKRAAILGDGFSLYEMSFAGPGAGAYLITPQAAAFYIDLAKRKFNLLDLFLYSERSMDLLQLTQALATQLQFIKDDSVKTLANSTIFDGTIKRPSGWESFRANPMTRVRRLKANLQRLYERAPIRPSTANVVPCDDLLESYLLTRAAMA